MKINNQHEFMEYMLKQHWDDHPSELIKRVDHNVIQRDVSISDSDFKSYIFYYCYYGEIDSHEIIDIHEISELADDTQVRKVIVWCKNKDSNGILFCSYQNFIDGLKDGEVDYSVFRWGDPTDDSSVGGKRT
jgi:hypothetical protein